MIRRLVCRVVGHRWDEFLKSDFQHGRMPYAEFMANAFEVRCSRCGARP